MKFHSIERLFVPVFVFVSVISLSDRAMAAPVVKLTASVLSPQPLGTAVTLTASATDTAAGTISYRFSIGAANGTQLVTARDYSVATTFVFTPTKHEGNYQFEVTARNNTTQQTSIAKIIPYQFTSLVTGSRPVVTATANPLVALFSAPSCPTGGYMRVNFFRGSTIDVISTPFQACLAGASMNFEIAGMRASTLYYLQSQTVNGGVSTQGPLVSFTTVRLP
jgi:hypothetical protein